MWGIMDCSLWSCSTKSPVFGKTPLPAQRALEKTHAHNRDLLGCSGTRWNRGNPAKKVRYPIVRLLLFQSDNIFSISCSEVFHKSQNHRLFSAGRDPQGSWSPALKWMAHARIEPKTLVLLSRLFLQIPALQTSFPQAVGFLHAPWKPCTQSISHNTGVMNALTTLWKVPHVGEEGRSGCGLCGVSDREELFTVAIPTPPLCLYYKASSMNEGTSAFLT